MAYCSKGKSVPINKTLYNRIKNKIKHKVKRWPSAYASAQLVREYKQKGGKYRCSTFGRSVPINKTLYNRIKNKIKHKVKRWVDAYAYAQLVREYKRKGGKYRYSRFGKEGLTRWFKEKWIDVCTGKVCGRKKGSKRKYPYCRPSIRVNAKTPKKASQLTRSEIKRLCLKKHRIKGKRIKN